VRIGNLIDQLLEQLKAALGVLFLRICVKAAAGHRVQSNRVFPLREAALGEQRGGRVQDALPVACGVGAQGRLRRRSQRQRRARPRLPGGTPPSCRHHGLPEISCIPDYGPVKLAAVTGL
jgi:hypothetical protein